MTQQSDTDQQQRKPSPLRGLAIALLLVVILFPTLRNALTTWVGMSAAALVGAAFMATVLSLSAMRK